MDALRTTVGIVLEQQKKLLAPSTYDARKRRFPYTATCDYSGQMKPVVR